MSNVKYVFSLLLLVLFYTNAIYATTHIVSSVALFNTAQSNAQRGDTIQWSSGTFSDVSLTITLKRSLFYGMEAKALFMEIFF